MTGKAMERQAKEVEGQYQGTHGGAGSDGGGCPRQSHMEITYPH